jgi:hypothetical protein
MDDLSHEEREGERWWNPIHWGWWFWIRVVGFLVIAVPALGWRRAVTHDWQRIALINAAWLVVALAVVSYALIKRRSGK